MESDFFKCPACDTDHIQRVALAYAKGTGTVLSSLLAPPKKKNWIPSLCISVALIICAMGLAIDISSGEASDTPPVWLFEIAIVLVAAWALFRAFVNANFNRKSYPILLGDWRMAYICLRCSHRFFPKTIKEYNEPPLTLDATTASSSQLPFQIENKAPSSSKDSAPKPMHHVPKFLLLGLGSLIVVGIITFVILALGEPDKDPIVSSPVRPQHPTAPVVSAQAKPISDEQIDKNLTECLLPKAQYGQYSSYDGGKSAMHYCKMTVPMNI